MGMYVKKTFRDRVVRVQVHSNSWNETQVNNAKTKILKEFAELFKNQYKESTPKTEYKFISRYEKKPVPNIDKSVLVILGGPFEQIGGNDEAVGGGSQKVGSDNK